MDQAAEYNRNNDLQVSNSNGPQKVGSNRNHPSPSKITIELMTLYCVSNTHQKYVSYYPAKFQ